MTMYIVHNSTLTCDDTVSTCSLNMNIPNKIGKYMQSEVELSKINIFHILNIEVSVCEVILHNTICRKSPSPHRVNH